MPRFRFSLRSFFLVLFVGCLIGSNIFTAFENSRLRQTNQKLQAELGHLVVGDPTRLHAVAVDTHEELTWRWRLHVPEGKSFQLRVATQQVPDSGLPGGSGAFELAEGDYTLTAAIRQDHLQKWRLSVRSQVGTFRLLFSDDHSQWIVDSPGAITEQAGSGGITKSLEPGELMVLLRHRTMQRQADGSSTTVAEPCDGVMIWIDEKK